jgi:hypothetical protein
MQANNDELARKAFFEISAKICSKDIGLATSFFIFSP